MEPDNGKQVLFRLEWWFWICIWFLTTGVIASSMSKLPDDFVKNFLIIGGILGMGYFVMMEVFKRRLRKR